MKQTAKEWANNLPEPIKSELLENIDESYFYYQEKWDSLVDVIGYSFDWSKSPQGKEYWYKVWLKEVVGDS